MPRRVVGVCLHGRECGAHGLIEGYRSIWCCSELEVEADRSKVVDGFKAVLSGSGYFKVSISIHVCRDRTKRHIPCSAPANVYAFCTDLAHTGIFVDGYTAVCSLIDANVNSDMTRSARVQPIFT